LASAAYCGLVVPNLNNALFVRGRCPLTGKVQIEITTDKGSVASKVPSSLVISMTDGNNKTAVEGKQISITSQAGKFVSEAIELQPGTYKVSRLSILDNDGKLLYFDEQGSRPVITVKANQLSTFSKSVGEITGINQIKSNDANAKKIIGVFLNWAHIDGSKFKGQVFVPYDSYLSSGANPTVTYNDNNKGDQSVSCKLLKYIPGPGNGAYYSFETDLGSGPHILNNVYVVYAYIPSPDQVQIVYDGIDKPYVLDNIPDNSDPDSWIFGIARIVVTKTPDFYQLTTGVDPTVWSFSPRGNTHDWQFVVLNDNGVPPFEIKLHYDVTGTFKDVNGNINPFVMNGGIIDVTTWDFIDGGPYRNYYNNSADALIATFPFGIVSASISMYADITFDYGLGNKITYTDSNLGDFYIYKN